MTRFNILCILLLVLALIGWPPGIMPTRLPVMIHTIIVVVILLVLILLEAVRV